MYRSRTPTTERYRATQRDGEEGDEGDEGEGEEGDDTGV